MIETHKLYWRNKLFDYKYKYWSKDAKEQNKCSNFCIYKEHISFHLALVSLEVSLPTSYLKTGTYAIFSPYLGDPGSVSLGSRAAATSFVLSSMFFSHLWSKYDHKLKIDLKCTYLKTHSWQIHFYRIEIPD